MGIPAALRPLIQVDSLRELTGLGRPAFIHNDHRWVLPIFAWAQLTGQVQRPALLVLFDHHTDFAKPYLKEDQEGRNLVREYNAHPTIEGAMKVCAEFADSHDGDWVSVGMELGIIGDAVVFGAERGHKVDEHDRVQYVDLEHREHSFWSLPWPSDCLAHQGRLADSYYKPHGLWEVLGWTPGRLNGTRSSVLLDFDLDAFAVDVPLGPPFAWPEQIFDHQFNRRSNAHSVEGMTAGDFVTELLRVSSLVTVAREPDYCGGEQDCDAIFQRVNRYLFNGAASVFESE